MIRASILMIVCLLAGANCFASTPATVPDRELSIGGVALGQTEHQALASLGKPLRRSDNGEGTKLEYLGMTVWVGWLEQAKPGVQRRVYELLSTSKQHCTPSAICPGTPLAKVRARFGAPLVADRESGRFLEYPSSQSSCWLQLSVAGGIIKTVRAACQP
jgi:hypothetical protein